MITNVSLGRYGRLGNQLYQYASAFNLSKKLNTEFWLPIESENYNTVGRYNPVINTYDKYSNDLFRLFDLKYVKKLPLDTILKSIKNNYIEPPEVKYYTNFWDQPNNTNLQGYFQAKEYVDLFENDLRIELKFNNFYFDYGNKFINNLKSSYNRVVSLHIRRGDGLMDNFEFNAELTIENYYSNILKDHIKYDDVILVFSDDIEWCKKMFKEMNKNFIFIDNRDYNYSHLKDFCLMSMCDVNIMAVSTFSWWACWLNPLEKEKIVFMPNKWWGKSLQNNSEEIYRYNKWIKYDN